MDRQLRGVEQLAGILAGSLREAFDLAPGLREAFGAVEIGEPAVAGDRRAPEYPVDIPADQDRRVRLLQRLRKHDAGGDVIAGKLAADRMLGPEPFQDVEALVHDLAALLERH